jgi:protoheme IX farnesyltransferase
MLPNVAGEDRTRLEILIYALALAPLGVAPWLLGFASLAYAFVSIGGGIALVGLATAVFKQREGEAARRSARRMFLFSILYLFVLFLELVVERTAHVFALI